MYKKITKGLPLGGFGEGGGSALTVSLTVKYLCVFLRQPQIDDEMTWIDCFLRMPIFVYNFGNFLQEGALASLSTSSQRLKIRIQH